MTNERKKKVIHYYQNITVVQQEKAGKKPHTQKRRIN
jgi:hypothetical protein